jgi:hypothetical protein
MATTSYQCVRFREFSTQHLLVRGEECANANLNLLGAYPLSNDCSDDMQKLRSPNCELRHGCAESRDQSKSQVLCSKHIVHHLEQKLHDVKVEQSGDKEYEQIYLI